MNIVALCVGAGLVGALAAGPPAAEAYCGLIVGPDGPRQMAECRHREIQDQLDTIRRQQEDAELRRQITETNRRAQELNRQTEEQSRRFGEEARRAYCHERRALRMPDIRCPEND